MNTGPGNKLSGREQIRVQWLVVIIAWLAGHCLPGAAGRPSIETVVDDLPAPAISGSDVAIISQRSQTALVALDQLPAGTMVIGREPAAAISLMMIDHDPMTIAAEGHVDRPLRSDGQVMPQPVFTAIRAVQQGRGGRTVPILMDQGPQLVVALGKETDHPMTGQGRADLTPVLATIVGGEQGAVAQFRVMVVDHAAGQG